jgi:hypothetical protein
MRRHFGRLCLGLSFSGLVVHVEKREQPVYELLLARGDGRLGSGMPRLLRVQRLRTSRHRLRRVRERRISRGVCLKSRAR